MGGTREGKQEAKSGALQGQLNLMGDQTEFGVCQERNWTRGYHNRRSTQQHNLILKPSTEESITNPFESTSSEVEIILPQKIRMEKE